MKRIVFFLLWALATLTLAFTSTIYAYKKGADDFRVLTTFQEMGNLFIYEKVLEGGKPEALNEMLDFDIYFAISLHKQFMMNQSVLSKAFGPANVIRRDKDTFISWYRKVQEHTEHENKDLNWLIENLE